MKIVELTKIGNPADVLELKEVPDTPLKAGDVRVKVLAAPIHPQTCCRSLGNTAHSLTYRRSPVAKVLARSSRFRLK